MISMMDSPHRFLPGPGSSVAGPARVVVGNAKARAR
jgi:hypothetical protein